MRTRTLSCARTQTSGDERVCKEREARFQIGVGGGGAGRGRLTLPVEVNRLLPRRNPSGVETLYRRRGGGFSAGEYWAGLKWFHSSFQDFCVIWAQ
jgi:hypothetical protein